MKITLENSISHIQINSNGAYVDNFEVKDKSILFPKLMVKIDDQLKLRGGMHVCAPNFGEDKILNELDKHGFCRDLDWEIVEYRNDFAKLSLDGRESYEDVKFVLEYKLDKSDLYASLTIKNKSKQRILVAPGFHPYFYVDQGPISINDSTIDKSKLENSIIDESKIASFVANGKEIVVEAGQNINEFVFWSDFKGDYICVEPTYKSIAFSDSKRDAYKLEAGEDFIQDIKIKVIL